MATFPTTPVPRYGTNSDTTIETVQTQSEAGYIRSRRKFSIPQFSVELIYDNISEAEFATLKTFFNTYQGTFFDFAYIENGTTTTYSVTFLDTKINHKPTLPGRVSTTIKLIGQQ